MVSIGIFAPLSLFSTIVLERANLGVVQNGRKTTYKPTAYT